jgi:threonyl-tRNA synthetase
MAIIGQREVDADSVAVRVRGAGTKQEVMPVEAFLERVGGEIKARVLAP